MAAKLKQEDLAVLTSRWWPHADLETLLDLVHFVGCIFTVDWVIDQVSGPSKGKVDVFEALHQSTDNFVEQGLHPSSYGKVVDKPCDSAMKNFHILSKLLYMRHTVGW
jgi:hypothetical protein